MTTFVDTSALLAVIYQNEQNHAAAKQTWEQLLGQGETLVCNNYVILETFTLIQRRFGMETARIFEENLLPYFEIEWVSEVEHASAVAAVLAANRRRLSLVDCASFGTMRRLGVRRAFTFDPHFAEQGFEVLPAPHTP